MAVFVPIIDVVEEACFSMDDFLLRNKMKFLRFAGRIYNDDMNLGAIKATKRQFMNINKRTNTIDLPENCLKLSAVSWVDESGKEWPLFRNGRLSDDIVDIKADPNCACGCKNELCNMIKGYESISEEVTDELPNGDPVTFTCLSIKGYDPDGTFYETKQYPIRRFTDGVWTGTELETEKIELCKLELDSAGCVVDCEDNFQAVATCGCGGSNTTSSELPANVVRLSCTPILSTFAIQSGSCYSAGMQFVNVYNLTELGNRLIFPPEFPKDKVLVRYYVNTGLKDIGIPSVARKAFISGLMFYLYENRPDRESQQLAAIFESRYTKQQFALVQEMNKYNKDEQQMIMTPPVRWP